MSEEVEFKERLDEALKKAIQTHGLVSLRLIGKEMPTRADPDFDAKAKAYADLVRLVQNYIEDEKGYKVEPLIYPDGYAFLILWKKRSPQDPEFAH